MTEHKGLSVAGMLWWIRKESDDFTLVPGVEDDDFHLNIVNNKQRKEFIGGLPNVLAAGYDFIAEDTEAYHTKVRDFFSAATCGLVSSSLEKIAQDDMAEQESS